MKCANGHEVDPRDAFCPICDAPVDQAGEAPREDSGPGFAAAPYLATCPKGHPLPAGVTDCPICARERLSEEEAAKRPLMPFAVAVSLMILGGVIVATSAALNWIVATGPVPHTWSAFHVGDRWVPTGGTGDGIVAVGITVVVLGTLFMLLGLASLSTLIGYRYLRSKAAFLITGGLPYLMVTLAFGWTIKAVKDFNATNAAWARRIPCDLQHLYACGGRNNGGLLQSVGEHATLGVGFWVFLAGLAIGTIGGAFNYLHQRRVDLDTEPPEDRDPVASELTRASPRESNA
jgi:hypothetical protein